MWSRQALRSGRHLFVVHALDARRRSAQATVSIIIGGGGGGVQRPRRPARSLRSFTPVNNDIDDDDDDGDGDDKEAEDDEVQETVYFTLPEDLAIGPLGVVRLKSVRD